MQKLHMDYAFCPLAGDVSAVYLTCCNPSLRDAYRANKRIEAMAVIDTSRAVTPVNVFGGLFKLFGAFAAWNDARHTRKLLSQLSDRELDDIGLSRGDIDRIRL